MALTNKYNCIYLNYNELFLFNTRVGIAGIGVCTENMLVGVMNYRLGEFKERFTVEEPPYKKGSYD